MYASNICKLKLLNNRKLIFPLPKIKTFPLTCLNLHEEISKIDVNIKNMDDDLNITEEKFFIDLKKIIKSSMNLIKTQQQTIITKHHL